MHHIKTTQNSNLRFQAKPKIQIEKSNNSNKDLSSTIQPNMYTGNPKSNQFSAPYNQNGLTYSQTRNQYPQSPTNPYIGVVNNQPYQQVNYEKKQYLQSPQNYSMTENKYSHLANSQSPSAAQKTIMFNKSK